MQSLKSPDPKTLENTVANAGETSVDLEREMTYLHLIL